MTFQSRRRGRQDWISSRPRQRASIWGRVLKYSSNDSAHLCCNIKQIRFRTNNHQLHHLCIITVIVGSKFSFIDSQQEGWKDLCKVGIKITKNQPFQASSIEITAKKTHYGVDGTGRDTYINFDNGGNYRGHVQHGLGKFERGEFPTGGRGRINSSYVPIEGRPLHYIGDGTGRDTYIITTEGGVSKGFGKKYNFLENLRAPIPRREIQNNDIYSRTQVGWRGKLPPTVGNEQRRLDRRLSEHRKYQDPYVAMRSTFRDSMRKGL